MITDDKVIEIFSLADDFCKLFNKEIATRLIQPERTRRKYSRKSTMSESEIITILVLVLWDGSLGLNCI